MSFAAVVRASNPSQSNTVIQIRYGSRNTAACDHADGPGPAMPQATAVDDQFSTTSWRSTRTCPTDNEISPTFTDQP
jgi:hypothetical protein